MYIMKRFKACTQQSKEISNGNSHTFALYVRWVLHYVKITHILRLSQFNQNEIFFIFFIFLSKSIFQVKCKFIW